MTEDEFWDVIEDCKREADVELPKSGLPYYQLPTRRAELLAGRLRRLPVAEIRSFQAWFECMISRAGSAETHAAFLLRSDLEDSDDGYLYFRTWLVGQGRLFYNLAIRDSDAMADALDPEQNPLEQTSAEELRYSATFACRTLTGLNDDDDEWPLRYELLIPLTDVYCAALPRVGTNEWIAEADLPKRLPKLAAKCEELWSRDPRRRRKV
jgi:hypothetical protein